MACFAEVPPHAARCATCGAPTAPERSYEQQLLATLSHRLPDRRLLAAELLGRLRSRAGIPRLAELALDATDPYLQAAAWALARIDADHPVPRHLAEHGPVLVRAALEGGRP